LTEEISQKPLGMRTIMNAKQILDSAEFKKCADFHGHVCLGLSIGYRAAKWP